jgi:hypothetical protein
MALGVSLKGGKQLMARLKAIGDTKLLLGRIALDGVAEAKRLVPRRTGNLGRTIRLGRVSATSAEILAGGTQKVGYAAAVEFGSGPRIIVPRRAKVLAWGGERTLGGRLRKGARANHFARRVKHPGTRAKPYLRPGVLTALQRAGPDWIVKQWNGAA